MVRKKGFIPLREREDLEMVCEYTTDGCIIKRYRMKYDSEEERAVEVAKNRKSLTDTLARMGYVPVVRGNQDSWLDLTAT